MNCELMLTYDTPALRQTGSRNLTGQKTLPTIWGTYMKLVTKYQISAIYLCPSVLLSIQDIFRRIFLSNCWWQKSDILSQASYRFTILWVAFLDPSDSYFLFADFTWLKDTQVIELKMKNNDIFSNKKESQLFYRKR
jgi:hypothetical protein